MKIKNLQKLALGLGLACALNASTQAQVSVPSTFKHITIDGSFADWSGVPLAYTAVDGATNAIEYQNIYIANDQTNLYIRFTLYAPRAAFQNSYDNMFFDTDNNPLSGFPVGGVGSEMLVQWGGGYQEKNGGFNEATVSGLGWNIAASPDNLDYEIAISLGATFPDSTLVFPNSTIAILLEGDDTGYANSEFAPPSGGLVYTFASALTPLTTNVTLIPLATSPWQANDAGADLGSNWLVTGYDDTVAGWKSGDGLFGYTPSPASYPTIQTTLAGTANTFYFRTHFQWTYDSANVAFVVTNYLSDGAVYYLNGTEVKRIRMPSGAITYSTSASATNSPVGHVDVFGVDGSGLLLGDNILEVETHQAAGSSADMVFGLSLTAAAHYSVTNVESNLPADQTVLAGQSVTFTSDFVASGPVTYQWYLNGTTAITGANASSYTIPFVLDSDAGTYSLVVSNSINTVTSRAALLIVSNIAVSITSQPTSQVAVEGRPVTFTVGVSGTPVIAYQWLFGGSPIAGATNASFTLNPVQAAQAGSYQVTVSNPVKTTNSAIVNLTVLTDTIPPTPTNIFASGGSVVVTFSEPVDPTTAADATKYSVSAGESVVSAVQNPANSAQVTLTVTPLLSLGSVYTLSINGVKDLFGNAAHASGQFISSINIDGSFDDWAGLSPIYTNAAPSGETNAADFEAIYVYNDASYYYFRVTLFTDIDSALGQFPAYVNMFFNTDGNSGTGYSAIGSELLIQSGYSYQEKNGSFNDNAPISGLNWLSLPTSPGTNFEFRLSLGATFADNTPVFSTNQLSFLFQGMTPGFVVENTVPAAGGVITYTNITTASVAPLPLGKMAISTLSTGQAAVVWDPPGTLQQSSTLAPGSWTNLPAATSPYVISASGAKKFFRLTR